MITVAPELTDTDETFCHVPPFTWIYGTIASGLQVGGVVGVTEPPPAFLYAVPQAVRFPFASIRAAVPRTFVPGSVPQYHE
jgi:hypothetical protein